MSLSRDINIKPSFLRELHALPSNMGDQVWEKMNFLAQSPIPDGHLKKKLNKWADVYRLRVGDYRIFYSFGSNWIRLLSIRARKQAYQKDIYFEEPSNLGTGPDPDLELDEEVAAGVEREWNFNENTINSKKLPLKITSEWLSSLKIPGEYHSELLGCTTEDDLLLSKTPENYIERVIDNLFPRPVTEIIQQPDLVVFDTNDLIRYKDGDLMGFLLRLDSEQERLVDWALQGPALIKGGPGTGKSTIALYRVRSIIDHQHSKGNLNIKILFSTYTPALAKFSEQLLKQLLGTNMNHVHVNTADDIALSVVNLYEQVDQIADKKQLKAFLEMLIYENNYLKSLGRFRTEYLLDEIEWIIEGRNLKSMNEYTEISRIGRGVALTKQTREIIWKLYESLNKLLAEKGLWTISRVRCRAFEIVRSGLYQNKYDSVIIDEAQDLTPISLGFLVELSSDKKGIYLTADASQSIYSKGFSWKEVHESLQFRGRALTLRRNYRSTREISEAANTFLKSTNSGDSESLMTRSIQTGPQPILTSYSSDQNQYEIIVKFLKQMSIHLRLKVSAAAILVPSSTVGKEVADGVTKAGIPARFMRGSKLDLDSDDVKVITLASSKGLEFPIVVLSNLDKKYPRFSDDFDEEELEEELKVARRTLFVGFTRAMRGLLVLYNKKNPCMFIKELSKDYWYIKEE
jgi:superfamily I DNA/RNA helicase/mRNA-degrading endonuclease RelE of RelBE toxin-antitoxin system